MKILFTICGRAGSKGVKNKNLRNFCGKPLAYLTVSVIDLYLKQHPDIEADVVVNSDSKELLHLLSNNGLLKIYTIERDASLAGDIIGKIAVIKDCLVKMEQRHQKTYDVIVDLDITSPLRTVRDLEAVINKHISSGASGADVTTTVAPARRNPYFNQVKKTEHGFKKVIESDFTARQQAPEIYDMNASIYAYKPEYLKTGKGVLDGYCEMVEMYDTAVLDLDHENDFELMETVAEHLFETKPGFKAVYENAPSMLHNTQYNTQTGDFDGFDNYLVIFIDILGSQNRTSATSGASFDEQFRVSSIFHDTFDQHGHALDHVVYQRKIYSFSDCAYIFYNYKAGIEEARKDLAKLLTVALCNCEPLFLRFLSERILFRGGIYYGKAYVDETRPMFFGEAVTSSYLLESKEAIHPRVLIDNFVAETVSDYLEKLQPELTGKAGVLAMGAGLRATVPESGYGIVEQDEDEKYIFNYLHLPENDLSYLGIFYNSGEDFIKELEVFCDEQIKVNKDYKIIDKYYYLKRFCNKKLDNIKFQQVMKESLGKPL